MSRKRYLVGIKGVEVLGRKILSSKGSRFYQMPRINPTPIKRIRGRGINTIVTYIRSITSINQKIQ
ncbi:MAG: hypothetical protein ACE5PM_06285, partial [Candidatus Hydrothermarchaeales archaeon]